MARIRFGAVAGGLRTGISAGSCGLSHGLPALGLAAPVLHRRIARAAYLVRARKGESARSLAPVPHGLDDLSARHFPPPQAIRLSRSLTGYDELHCPRHSGHVPALFAATTRFQSAAHVGLHRDFDDRRALRRDGIRVPIFRPPEAARAVNCGGAARTRYHPPRGQRPTPPPLPNERT